MYRNLIIILFITTTTTLALELTCRYKTNTDWWAINDVYFCDLEKDLDISKSNAVITVVTGDQLNGKSNADVIGFRAYNKKLNVFPQGLENYFNIEKIEFIAIWNTGLKEIHQNDLSPYTNVKVLSLWNNDFEVIERDLLKFNPHIEYIGLGKNKIKFVDGNVFGHLKNLHSLYIDGNSCISKEVSGDKNQVLDLVHEIKEKCSIGNDVEPGSDYNLDVRIGSSSE